jgi:hypothetical protein
MVAAVVMMMGRRRSTFLRELERFLSAHLNEMGFGSSPSASFH